MISRVKAPISQQETAAPQSLFEQFPMEGNRETLSGNREYFAGIREFTDGFVAKPTFGRISIGKLNDGILADLPRTRSWRANYPVMIATGGALAQHQGVALHVIVSDDAG